MKKFLLKISQFFDSLFRDDEPSDIEKQKHQFDQLIRSDLLVNSSELKLEPSSTPLSSVSEIDFLKQQNELLQKEIETLKADREALRKRLSSLGASIFSSLVDESK
jgi:hypothetical protein